MNKNREYRTNSKIVTIGVLAVVVIVNIFATMLVKKVPVKLDTRSFTKFPMKQSKCFQNTIHL